MSSPDNIAETVFGCHGATKFNPSNLLPKYSMTISDNDDASQRGCGEFEEQFDVARAPHNLQNRNRGPDVH
jgi:hypothetical protein